MKDRCIFVIKSALFFFTTALFSCSSYFEISEKEKNDIKSSLMKTYTVNHYVQNVDDDEYTLYETDEPSPSGRVGSFTAAAPRECKGAYEGFMLHESPRQQPIADNGSTVVGIYYDRKKITVTLDPKGMVETGDETIDGNGYFLDADGREVTEPVVVTGRYGAEINLKDATPPVSIAYTGFVFHRWEAATIPAVDGQTARAVWRDEQLKDYKVFHHLQDTTGDGYDNNPEDGRNLPEIEILSGRQNTLTTAVIKPYNRFFCVGTSKKTTDTKEEMEASRVTGMTDKMQHIIASDNSTEVHLYYNRNVVRITLDAGRVQDSNGTDHDGAFYDSDGALLTQEITIFGRYGATIPDTSSELREVTGYNLPSLVGYLFDHWNPRVFPAEDGTVSAVWRDATIVDYKVRHHFQDITGDGFDNDKKYEEIIFPGKVGESTIATKNEYTGFACMGTSGKNDGTILQEEIEASNDGSIYSGTVVDIYYARNEYTVRLDSNGGAFPGLSTNAAKEFKARYLAPIPTTDEYLPTYSGHTFHGWSIDKVPANNTTVASAVWQDTNSVTYKVSHIAQGIDGQSYNVVLGTNTFTSRIGLTTVAQSHSYTGFTCVGTDRTTADATVMQKTIAESGNDITIYYNRNKHTITLDANGGYFGNDTSVKTKVLTNCYYDSAIPADGENMPIYKGYVFLGWNEKKVSDSDMTVKAVWRDDDIVSYTVHHWQENIFNDEYTEYESQTLAGRVDQMTAATTMTYAGFTCLGTTGFSNGEVTQKTIALGADNDIHIYYKRTMITLTFNSDGGTVSISSTNATPAVTGDIYSIVDKYGAELNLGAPIKKGYTFIKWSSEVPSTFDFAYDNVEFTAYYEANDVGISIVFPNADLEMGKITLTETNDTIVLSAPSGYVSYKWICDTLPCTKNGAMLMIDKRNEKINAGVYNAMIVVTTMNGGMLSDTIVFQLKK